MKSLGWHDDKIEYLNMSLMNFVILCYIQINVYPKFSIVDLNSDIRA